MSVYNACLAKVPLFDGLDESDLVAISNLIDPLRIEKDAVLLHPGDVMNHLYVIHQGSLKLVSSAMSGNERVVRLLAPGSFVGEQALLQAQVAAFEIRALKDSKVCKISGEAFKDLLSTSPHLAMKIINALLNRLHESDQKLSAVSNLGAKERLLNGLLEHSDAQGRVVLGVSKKDFASSLGMASETLSRQLRQLETEKSIQINSDGSIHII